MLRPAIVPILVLVSTTLAAQAVPSAPQPASSSAGVASACPVSLHALQGSGSGLVAVRNQEPPQGPSQHIHLVLSDTRARHAVSAKVLVRGLSGKGQRMETRLASDARPDLSRALDVRLVRESESEVSVDLLLPGFTSVRSIELQSIGYADGSTWALAGGETCSVAPDPMMLIAGR